MNEEEIVYKECFQKFVDIINVLSINMFSYTDNCKMYSIFGISENPLL